MKLIVSTFNTPFGGFEVHHDEQHIHRANFSTAISQDKINSKLGEVIANELDTYLKNPFHRFQLPLKPQGTPYQLKVWNALLVIPAGRAISYGELSTQLDSSPRAIGQACKKNPLAIFIPCHRVVGKYNYGGYMGQKDALSFKILLLNHEQFNAVSF